MLYQIQFMTPQKEMSGHGIQVNFWPEWKDAVARYGINQRQADAAVKSLSRAWLDGCGYDAMHDPDADPLEKWNQKHLGTAPKLGSNARPLYDSHSIRVTWGEWGPEHITVPGNACGLDLSHSIGSAPGGMSLLPHNVDSMSQAYLLLLVFTWFADAIICNESLISVRQCVDGRISPAGE